MLEKIKKIPLSFSQIINMNIGFFGIQYSFGLQQTAINPICSFLGGVPYVMVISDTPAKKRGMHMGIINMMIVVPMIIQTFTFGSVYKYLLGDDPTHAIMFAGALFPVAALLTQRIREHRNIGGEVVMQGGGH